MFPDRSFQFPLLGESGDDCLVTRSDNFDFSIRRQKSSPEAQSGRCSVHCRSETPCDMQFGPTPPALSMRMDRLRLSPSLSKITISSLVAGDSDPGTAQRRHEERAELAAKALVAFRRLKSVRLKSQP